MSKGIIDLAIAYENWKKKVREAVELFINCSSDMNGSKKHFHCPNPLHNDVHPSFRFTPDGNPVCTCGTIKWDNLASWVGAISWEAYKQSLSENPGVLTKARHYRASYRPVQQPLLEPMPTDYAANADAWQIGARGFHNSCIAWLYDLKGKQARDYLEGRGITEGIMGAYELGYNPVEYRTRWGDVDIWLPPGIVIPWIDGSYQTIRVRPISEQYLTHKKYHQPSGAVGKALYFGTRATNPVSRNHIAVLVEGEFDAMLIRFKGSQAYCKGEYLYPVWGVATGSISGGRSMEAINKLAAARQVLIAFDNEIKPQLVSAVDNAALWWLNRLSNAQRLLPTQHDITDMLTAGDDLISWLKGESEAVAV